MVRNSKRLQEIRYKGNCGYVVDFLEQMVFPRKLFLTITKGANAEDVNVAYDVLEREKNVCLKIKLPFIATETVMAIIKSISPESLGEVLLNNIALTESEAATLDEALPKMTSFESSLETRHWRI